MVKNLPAMQETRFPSQDWEDSPEKGNGYPLQYSCLEKSMDRGSYSPWGHKESDMIEQLTHREFYLQKNRLSEVILVITNEETFEAK